MNGCHCDSLSRLKKQSFIKGYSFRHVYFESVYKGMVDAYLFVPKKVSSNPAILYLNFENNGCDSLVEEVESLVQEGYVTLVIDSPFVKHNHDHKSVDIDFFRKTIEELIDFEKYFKTILDLRGWVDFLSNIPYVDKERIAYIGYGLGATWGGVLAGVEERVKTYLLIAGSPKASDWYLKSEHSMAEFIRFFLSPERYEYFISNVEKLNALHYIKNAAPASVFFQFAQHDEYVTEEQSSSYFSAASSPKKISWYNTDHLFTGCVEAGKERQDWLHHTIGKGSGNCYGDASKTQKSSPV